MARLQSVLDALQVFLPGVFVVLVVWLGARYAVAGPDQPRRAGRVLRLLGVPDDPAADRDRVRQQADPRPGRGRAGSAGCWRSPPTSSTPTSRPRRRRPAPSSPTPAPGCGSGPACMTARGQRPARRGGRAGGPARAVRARGRRRRHAGRRPAVRRCAATTYAAASSSPTPARRCSPAGSATVLDVDRGDPSHAARSAAPWRRPRPTTSSRRCPTGWTRSVAERGRTFSGGQRQRLVLARALAGDPEILVLVEPTSAVDAHTEARIAARLRGAPRRPDHRRRHRRARWCSTRSTRSRSCATAVVVATGTHAELLDDPARLPRRGDPRDRARGAVDDERAAPRCRSPTRGRCAATSATWPAGTRGCSGTALALHVLRRAGRAGRAAAARRPGGVGRRGHDRRPRRTGSCSLLAGFLLLQTVLTRYARLTSQVLGEQVLAELREDFVGNALALPVGVVESAGSGDLLTRTSRDVDQLGWSVRWALPEWTIAVITAVLTFVAAVSVGWWVLLPCLLGPAAAGDRAALVPRPRQGRLPARERVVLRRSTRPSPRPSRAPARSRPSGSGRERIEAIDDDIAESYAAERYTLYLRTVFFPSMELSYLIPTVATLLLGGYLYTQGQVSPRRGHRGDPLRADAHRPGRPDRLDPRRAPDGRRLAGPAARRRPGARRPRGHRRGARRRAARRARRAVLLRRGPRRAARRRPRGRRRRADRDGRARPVPASRRSAGCWRASTRRAPAR